MVMDSDEMAWNAAKLSGAVPTGTLSAGALAKLQRLIDRTVRASNDFQMANNKLMAFCREHYGCEPGDVDADQIIDGVQGGNGMSAGMKAQEFDDEMRPRSKDFDAL